MSKPIHIRFAGYSPPDTTHSRAAAHFREALTARLGQAARVDIFWNVFDFSYKGLDLHCGRCGTCVERREAFHLAGVPDPTQYSESSPSIEEMVSADWKVT